MEKSVLVIAILVSAGIVVGLALNTPETVQNAPPGLLECGQERPHEYKFDEISGYSENADEAKAKEACVRSAFVFVMP